MHLQFTAMEDTRGYPASVPVTPTCEYQSAFDDGFCKNSFSGSKKRGRTPGVRSTDVSRRPSLAQMHVMPLTMKVESGLLRPAENFRGHRWEIPSQAEAPMPPTTAPGLSTPAFADPSSAFWRLEGQDMGAGPYITPQPSIDNFRPFNSFDAPTEIPDEQWRSQVSSRVGSIDQGAGTGYSFGAAYSPETEFAPPPDLCSASTSTASLVASVSEVSVYGGDPRPVGQFYMNQWATQSQPAYPSGMPLKPELYDDPTSMYHTTGEAGFTNPRDATFVFQTPNHSPTPANMPGP